MPFTYTCEQCDKDFTCKRRRKGNHLFCSRKCYHEWTKQGQIYMCQACGQQFYVCRYTVDAARNKYCSSECYHASRAPQVTKICPVCKKEFSVKASDAHKYTRCSIECRLANVPYEKCERCGKVFKGEHGRTRRHCSEKCRRPPHYTNCLNCDKRFRHIPGRERRFCSFHCYRAYQGETKPEKKVREILEQLGIKFKQEFPVGRYSIDFMLIDHNIALEVDGVYWHPDPEKDKRRAKQIESKGYKVLHISDLDIMSSESPASLIRSMLQGYL